jgi:hypothetical protein
MIDTSINIMAFGIFVVNFIWIIFILVIFALDLIASRKERWKIMPKKYSLTEANNIAYDLLAIATNPSSFYAISDFPGCNELGIEEEESPIIDAIVAILASFVNWIEYGENSASFGRLTAMLSYGIVTKDQIINALIFNYRRRNNATKNI